jgi:alginate O-acetyltransferase complex protein AlgI
MNLNSPIFLFLFFPVFIICYYFAPKRAKLIIGILGSLLFYAWGNLNYVLLMLGLTLFTYLLARGINRWRGQRLSFILLWIGILTNITLLVGFKLWTGIRYPLGLSYITFQVIAYLVEVHGKPSEYEKDLIAFSFYLLLFPKIPVGPITRYRQLREQIQNIQVEPQDVADGIRRFIRGFAKKALIADTLAKVVAPIFNLDSPVILPSIAWLVILSYSLQLYFDFSGYTDMAIGVGRMMGFRFVENFNFPYLSKNIGEFWRRWHISLSSWFRDFVFYPLERRRLKWIGQPVNILVVFALTGLWHGLTRNFLIWGLIHGLALIFESTSLGKKLRTAWSPVQHIYALSVILVGWVFFRSPTPDFALDFLRRLAGDMIGFEILPFELTSPLPIIEPTFLLALAAGLLLSFPIGGWLQKQMEQLTCDRLAVQLPFQVLYDLWLAFILLASIASTANAAFQPGIYGTF